MRPADKKRAALRASFLHLNPTDHFPSNRRAPPISKASIDTTISST